MALQNSIKNVSNNHSNFTIQNGLLSCSNKILYAQKYFDPEHDIVLDIAAAADTLIIIKDENYPAVLDDNITILIYSFDGNQYNRQHKFKIHKKNKIKQVITNGVAYIILTDFEGEEKKYVIAMDSVSDMILRQMSVNRIKSNINKFALIFDEGTHFMILHDNKEIFCSEGCFNIQISTFILL